MPRPSHTPSYLPLELLGKESELVERVEDAEGGGDADLKLVSAEGGGLLGSGGGLESGGSAEEDGEESELSDRRVSYF